MTLDAAFDDAVRRFPERCAVRCSAGVTTYAQLARYSQCVAGWLQLQGVGRGGVVATLLPRSLELIALLIAVARLGGVSAPLDASMPLKRREASMRQLDAALTVEATDRGAIGRVMRDPRALPARSEAMHEPDDLALVFFTSGSTGVPKGVAVPHIGITLLMRDPEFVPVTPGSRIAHLANPAFDALSFDLWAGLLNGACVVVFDEDESLDPERLARRLTVDLCDTAFLTASLFKLLTDHAPGALARMSHLLVGGEAFDPAAACRLYEQCADARVQLYNAYGPTEFATFALVHRVERARLPEYLRLGRVPIGRPVRGTAAIVLADDRSIVAEGENGELFLAGLRIARGYVGNKSETALRFVELPSESDTSILAYATGDRVRRNAAGEIEFVGRLDDQVKVRGHRVEVDDVVSAIAAQPGVIDAVVLPHRSPCGTIALHAFVQIRDEASLESVRLGVCECLPPYMVPATYQRIQRVPLNRNGKADRRQLERLVEAAALLASDSGIDGLEAAFVAAYRQILGREPDLSRSYGEGGGDSLAAVRVAAAVGKRCGMQLRFTDFVQRRPLRVVLADLADRSPGMPQVTGMADDHGTAGVYAAASEQERLYFLRRLAPGSDAYNAVFRFDVPVLDEDRLRRAMAAVQARNPLLSARFRLQEQLVVELSPSAPASLATIETSGADAAEAHRLCFEAFEPDQPVAWRLVYEKRLEGNALWVAFDHLVVDSWSLPIFLGDLSETYAAASNEAGAPAEITRHGHAAYCRSRRAEIHTAAYAAQLQAWRESLTRKDAAALSIGGGGGRRYPRIGRARADRMSADCWSRLQRHATEHGNTAFVSLMSAWVAAVCRVLGREHLAVGFPISRRMDEAHAACVGLFSETLLGEFDAQAEDRLDLHHARVVSELEAVFSRHQTSFADIAAAAPRPRRGVALFDTMLVLEDLRLDGLALEGQRCSGSVVRGRDTKFPLTLFVTPDGDGAELVIEHDPEVVSGDQIDRLLAELRDPFAAEDPPSRSLGSDELDALLLDFGRHHPSSPAIGERESMVSYGELEIQVRAKADAVAAVTPPEARVGILMDLTTSALVALLGILKAGRVYVPLDPALPPARLAKMIEDVALRFAVCDGRHHALAQSLGLQVIGDAPLSARDPPERPLPAGAERNRSAYVLFTSGSTGRPKGVEATRRGLANYLRFAAKTYYAPGRAGIVGSPLSFDATLTTLLAPLVVGGTARLLSPGVAAVPELAAAIAGSEASVFKVTPSHLVVLGSYLTGHGPVRTPHVFVIGGEALTRASARAFAQICPNARLVNEYGPTETVVGCAFHEIREDDGEDVPVGLPIDGMIVEVVTEQLTRSVAGETGELLIRGPGVANGYVGRPELTAQKFVQVPGRAGCSVAYRSGDLGRVDALGRLRFGGRRDGQVKIRGHRVELGEIETALASCPTVAAAAVVLVARPGQDSHLVGFVSPRDGILEREIRTFLAESLPGYMVPARILRLATLPLTPNEKVDRQALLGISTAADSNAADVAVVEPKMKKMRMMQEQASEWLANSLSRMMGRPIGLDENFFDAGANSLMLMRLHASLVESYGSDIELGDFFSHPTIRVLAEKLGGVQPGPGGAGHRAPGEPPTCISVPTPGATVIESNVAAVPQERVVHSLDSRRWLEDAIRRLVGRKVGGDENFFDAGFSSLTLMRLHADAVAEGYRELTLSEVFDNPTTVLLARHMAEQYQPDRGRVDQVSEGATSASIVEAVPMVDQRQMAIIGMAVDLPGAPDLATFWDAIESGRDCILRFGEPRTAPRDAVFVPAVSMLGDPLGFDAAYFGIPAHEARLMDPQQRVLLMLAASALANAGIAPTRESRKSIGVAVSASENTYLRRIWEAEQAGNAIDPFLVSLLNEKDLLSSRLAYHFNLDGPALTIQTACSSSLTALHVACDQLRAGACDLFLVGGVCIDVSKADGYVATRNSIYSADGYCRSFSAEAGGTVPASGAAMVVLKPLRSALRDGDRIYAVVRGTAINNDGAQKVNIAAPSERGQVAVIRAALAAAHVGPEEIGYVETHGTGTRLGDPIEFRALAKAFGPAPSPDHCSLGALKSQMGHLGAAAGAAGVVRAALAVYHGVKPPTLHVGLVNDQISLYGTSFNFPERAAPWEAEPRLAAVSSFGIGGANAHAVLASAPHAHQRADLPAWNQRPVAFERKVFDVRDAERDPPRIGDVQGWFYRPSWVRLAHRQTADRPAAEDALIVVMGQDGDLMAELAQGFGVACRKFVILDDAGSFGALAGRMPVSSVVYCPGRPLSLSSWDDLRLASDQLIEGQLGIVRAWNAARGGEPLNLVTVTRGLDCGDPEGGVPGLSLALGPQAVLPIEHPHIRAYVLDLFGSGTGDRASSILEVLDQPIGVYALRQGILHVRQLVGMETSQPSRPDGIESGDTVVITGGLGGIGRQLAAAILEVPRTRVVLLGRSAAGTTIDSSARLSELRCDITLESDVAASIGAIRSAHGRIHGVIHAAGLSGSGLVDFNSAADRLAVLSPKVLGAVMLHAALRDDPPRYVVHCSSLSALFGVAGQVDYSAANAFLDAFAATTAREGRSTIVSINWPTWENTGMAASPDPAGQRLPDGLQIRPSDGCAVFREALSARRTQLVVCPLPPKALEAQLRERRPGSGAAREILTGSESVKTLVRSAFLSALGQNDIDDAASFFDLGGDSWNAMLLVSALQGSVLPSMSMAELIGHPSVETLARRASRMRPEPGAPEGAKAMIVTMKEGERPPIAFFHPVGGDLVGYREVIAGIGHREVLGLRGLGTGDDFETLEHQASAYRCALSRSGAPTLVGWSYGAVLAWEVARQREAEGLEVGRLVLIDPPLPDVSEQRGELQSLDEIVLRELDPSRSDTAIASAAELASSPLMRSVMDACKANTRRLMAYRPHGRVCCPVVVAVATQRPQSWGEPGSVMAAWQKHSTNEQTCIELPGGHYDSVCGPNAKLIALLLQGR